MSLFFAITDDLMEQDDPGRFVAIVGFGPEPGFPKTLLMGHVNGRQDARIINVMCEAEASHQLRPAAQSEHLSAIRTVEFPYNGETEEEIATRVFDRLEELGEIPMGCFDPDDDIEVGGDFAGFDESDGYGPFDEPEVASGEEPGILDPLLEWAVDTRDKLLDREDAGWGDLDDLEGFINQAHDELDRVVKREGLDAESSVVRILGTSCRRCWVGCQQLRTPGLADRGTNTLIKGIRGLDVAVAELAV